MNNRLTKLRLRRGISSRRQQAAGLGDQAEKNFERYFLKRLERFKVVRRFAITWTLLLVFAITAVLLQTFNLSNYYQTVQSVPGGTYREGVLGTFSTANPMYATSNVDNTVTRLLFNGLFVTDNENNLVGDLAQDYEVNRSGTSYTVRLKPGSTWHDGKPVTSADVLYTYQSIQNPDAQSPLRNSFQGIQITAPDPLTVVFTLPSQLASFPNTLVNGIVPKHRLSSVAPAELRTADFNTIDPVGTGPFRWQAIQATGTDPRRAREQVAMTPFEKYRGGTPKIERFVVHAFADQGDLVKEFKAGGLSSVVGLSSMPEELKDDKAVQARSLLLTAGTYTFFKTTHPVLSSQKVRQALVQGVDQSAIIKKLSYMTKPVNGPLLTGQLANDPSLGQPKYDLAAAKAALDADGWVVQPDGTRKKADQALAFNVLVMDSVEFRQVATSLKDSWKALGAAVNLRILSAQDFQNSLSFHDYDAVVYGISIGTDPDVFVYWDSSQVDIRSANRLNFSEYKNDTVDTALEAGRTRFDPQLRTVKYRPFLEAWKQDLPALGLYQPRILYITRGTLDGFEERTINTSTDRFSNVQNWMIREAKVTNSR